MVSCQPEMPAITVEKHKVLQVLVNLIRNAKYACDESGRKDKRLILRIESGNGFLPFTFVPDLSSSGRTVPPCWSTSASSACCGSMNC